MRDDREDVPPPANRGRFQKGKTGNPRGRPRKAPSVDAAILGALGAKVPIKENGRKARVTKLQAAAMQMANKGAAGDVRAAKMTMEMAQKAEERLAAAPAPAAQLTVSDEEAVERVFERFRLILEEKLHGPRHTL